MNKRIYLDNNSTTPIDPRVLKTLTQSLHDVYGNPSSLHQEGQTAKRKLAFARAEIAAYFSLRPQQIVFTSGGTEGLATVIHQVLQKHASPHIISSGLEHAATFAPLQAAKAKGARLHLINPGAYGAPTVQEIEEALLPDTCLIALMAVNNETGVKADLEAIAKLADQNGIPLLIDGVSWLGKEKITLPKGVSAACFSGHKFHAPKGVGFIALQNFELNAPLIMGGEQEMGMRGGTPNLNSIVAMAEAITLLKSELPGATHRMERLRDHFEQTLFNQLEGVEINGTGPRICNTSNLSFDHIEGETLLSLLDIKGLAASHGSACSSGALEPSRVLLNMGLKRERAQSAIRFSLSRMTTDEEVEMATKIIIEAVKQLRTSLRPGLLP